MTTGDFDLDTFPKLLMHHSRERGERPAIREKSRGIWRTVTWRELAEEAATLTAAMSARGLQRGAHVALLGDNRPRLYAAMCAAQMLGAVVVPLYQDATADEIASLIASAKVTHVFAENQEQVDKLLEILPRCPTVQCIVYDKDRGMRHYAQRELVSYASLLQHGRELAAGKHGFLQAEIASGSGQDSAFVFFTSGTTGPAKGVVLTHASLIDRARVAASMGELKDTDVAMAYLPPGLSLSGVAAAGAILAASLASTPAMAQQPEQYFPVASMRVGPYNAMGTGIFGGVIDYLNYVNIKHGGVNGVKLVYEECETEYNAARSVECYQRLLNRGDQKMLLWDPYGTPLAYAVIGRVAADNVVLAQAGYGRTDAADGRVWPWVFGATANYWSQIAMKLNFIQQQEGGIDKMKGKTIVHLHIDTAYGREPLPAMRQIAKDWGVNLIEIPIAPPGLEQQSQWLQIRQAKADWVTFWGAGAGMSGTAITSAARVGFPRNKIIFVTFGGAEEDMIAGGAQAKDTHVVAMVLPGKQWPLIADIEKTLYSGGAGKGNMQNPNRVGTIYYNRGVIAAVNYVEALRNAQKIHNKVGKPVTGAEFRDGYEALDYTDDARRKELGIDGMIPPYKLTCRNHEGAGTFHMMQWDGSKFQIVTKDWMGANDPKFIRQLIEDSAEKYAKENNITLRDCPN